MVIKESMRALTYLNLYGITVDQIIINRIFTDDADGEFLKEWKEIQSGYIAEIERSFAPIPITRVPLFRREVLGIPMLRKVAEEAYHEQNPMEIFYHEEHVEIKKNRGRKLHHEHPPPLLRRQPDGSRCISARRLTHPAHRKLPERG